MRLETGKNVRKRSHVYEYCCLLTEVCAVRKTLNDGQTDEIVRMYGEGKSMQQIAVALVTNYSKVRNTLVRRGVARNTRGFLSTEGRAKNTASGRRLKGRTYTAETIEKMRDAAKRRAARPDYRWSGNPAHDLSGLRFGRLVVEARDFSVKREKPWWRCVCDCGTSVVVRASSLKNGSSASCGCLARDNTRERSVTHGLTGSRTYISWRSMLSRCLRDDRAERYYMRVTICERWMASFEAFLGDMGERPDGMTIDRIDNAKGYEPGNCRWATYAQQTANRTLQSKEQMSERAKRTVPRGERHLSAKLSDALVVEVFVLRRSGATYEQIANRLGVTKAAIGRVLKRRTWTHVQIPSELEEAP